MNKINLDKICAEYGMDLLNKFSDLTFDELKDSLGIKETVDNYKYNNSAKFDRSKINEYKQEIKNKIEEIENAILNDDERDTIYKYLLTTWFLSRLKSELLNEKKIKNEIIKEKKRIEDSIKNCCKFDFSSSTFETEITKALGILVEDGPFAYMIWLKSQDKEPHRAMLIQTARILAELNLIEKINPDSNLKQEIESRFIGLSGDLSKLLLTKTILEKMLIYARYKAKAMQHE